MVTICFASYVKLIQSLHWPLMVYAYSYFNIKDRASVH